MILRTSCKNIFLTRLDVTILQHVHCQQIEIYTSKDSQIHMKMNSLAYRRPDEMDGESGKIGKAVQLEQKENYNENKVERKP